MLQKLGQAQVDIVRPSVELEKALLQKFGLPYGPARTKFAPTMTQVRIMAQPVGEETVPGIAKGLMPIEEQHPLEVPKGAQPVTPAGKAISTGQGDEYTTRGKGMDIHDMVNEIVTGPHGAAAARRG